MASQPAPLGPLALSRSGTDRAGHRRVEPDLLQRLRADPATRVLRLAGGRTPVVVDGDRLRPDLASPQSEDEDVLWIYLGAGPDGVEHLAAVLPDGAFEPAAGQDWRGLRDVGVDLDDTGAGLLTAAVALANWHATHTHCPRCGAPTVPETGGWTRRCPRDGSEHYPRTDPAIIVAVTDEGDRILLGHNPMWPAGRYSTLAGFVEPGESLEAAVRREVAEESGVAVGEVTYEGSQPWPFPASLMIGCRGVADDPRIVVDGVEIADARWFSREGLRAEVLAGDLLLPGGISIAHRLVEQWYGGPLPRGEASWR